MLEELLALGHAGAEYDAWLIRINEGDQFGSGFVAVNPNSKIPALVDRSGPDADSRVRVGRDPDLPRREVRRVPADRRRGARRVPVVAVLADGQRAVPRRRLRPLLRLRADQDRIRDRPLRDGGQAPARRARPPPRRERAISPATNTRSPTSPSGPGTAPSSRASSTSAGEFLLGAGYTNVLRWTDEIAKRPAVQRGRMVNRTFGEPSSQLHERHDASDFDDAHGRQARAVGVSRAAMRDHALRLRHRAEPAPRAHPAGREGRRATRRCRSTCAPASSWATPIARSIRSAPCRRCAPTTGCLLTDNAAIAAWLEARFPEPPLLGVTPAEKAEVASWNWRVEFEGLLAIAEAMRNSAPAMADRALDRAGELRADPRARRARPGAGAAVLRRR